MKKLIKAVVGLCCGIGTLGVTALAAGATYDFGVGLTDKVMKKFDKPSKEEEDSTTKEEN